MNQDYPLITKVGGLGIALLLRGLMSSVEVKLTHHDRSVDPALPEFRGGLIYVMWHEYIAFPIPLWREYNLALLASRHRDADWLIRAAHHLGFDTVRGSTNRGGSEAIRELKRKAAHSNLVITPDGPRGPRREMALGPIYLASRLGLSLVPVGFGFDRPFRMRTWDRFAIPRPGSRGRAIFGPRISIPKKLRKDGLEHHRVRMQSLLEQLSTQAEDWATSGGRMEGECQFERIRKAYDAPSSLSCESEKSIRLPVNTSTKSDEKKPAREPTAILRRRAS